MRDQKTCLSYWYPRVKELALAPPMPKTHIIRILDEKVVVPLAKLAMSEVMSQRDLDATSEWLAAFAQSLKDAGMDFPLFLRTGLTSNKHNWKSSCYVEHECDLRSRVMKLVEFSVDADMLGLPFNVWVAREMIPTKPVFHAFSGYMPIVREFRCFGRDGQCECIHPYWPEKAIRFPPYITPPADWKDRLREISLIAPSEYGLLVRYTEAVTKALGGYWSADFLQSASGEWWLTDMAEGELSFHWPDCPCTKREPAA